MTWLRELVTFLRWAFEERARLRRAFADQRRQEAALVLVRMQSQFNEPRFVMLLDSLNVDGTLVQVKR